MNTKQSKGGNEPIGGRPVIGVRLRQEAYERIKALSEREHRGIGAQCAVFVERQLALEEAEQHQA